MCPLDGVNNDNILNHPPKVNSLSAIGPVQNSPQITNETQVQSSGYEITKQDENALQELKADFEEVEKKQGGIGKAWNGFKNLTGLGLSSDDVQEKINNYEKSLNSKNITKEELQNALIEAEHAIASFEQKQDAAVDTVANVAAGAAIVGTAVATGGVSLVGGAAIGAGVKAGLKTIDRATNDVEGDALNAKQIAKDGLTGAVDGVVAVATAGTGSVVVEQTVGQAVKAGAIQGAKQGLLSGAATGAASYTANAVFDGDEFTAQGLLQTTTENALAGAAFGGVAGGASSGIAQIKLNGKVSVSHIDNFEAVNNMEQATQYLDNYNLNHPDEAIVDSDEVLRTLQALSDNSKQAEDLTKYFDGQVGEVTDQVNGIFKDKDAIEAITSRPKSQKSTFAKAAKKTIKGDMKTSLSESKDLIADSIGVRAQMKDIEPDVSRKIAQDIFKQNNINSNVDDFIQFLKDPSSFDEATQDAFLSVQDDILNSIKETQTEPVVSQIVDGIKSGKLHITELNNYGDDITSYFSDRQVQQIIDAYDSAVKDGVIEQGTLKVVTNSADVKMSKIGQDGSHTNAVITQEGAIKDSGYTSSQMNTIHTLQNGDIAYGELQIRGTKVNTFGDIEHIPYDIRSGKIYKSDAKYSDIYDCIRNMNDTDYASYDRYLSDVYKELRLQEMGLSPLDSPLPSISDYFESGNVSKDMMKLLDFDGLSLIAQRGH